MSSEHIRGRIEVIFRYYDGWFSGVFVMRGVSYKIAGNVDRIPHVGMFVEGDAVFVSTVQYGDQWQPVDFFQIGVSDSRSYMALMASNEFLNVDEAVARRVWKKFGDLNLLIDSLKKDADAFAKFCNLTEEQVTDFYKALIVNNQYKRLVHLFPHMTVRLAKNLIDYATLDDRKKMPLDVIVTTLRTLPYSFLHTKGVSFLDLDAVAIYDCGVDLNNHARMYYVIGHILRKFMGAYGCMYLNLSNQDECYYLGDDDVYYTKGSFLAMMLSKDSVPLDSNFDEIALRKLWVLFQSPGFVSKGIKKTDLLCFEKSPVMINQGGQSSVVEELHLYTYDMWNSKDKLVNLVVRLVQINKDTDLDYQLKYSRLCDYLKKQSLHLNAEQLSGLKTVFSNRISIVTGGPGRGKTFVLEELIPAWESIHGSHTVMCIGPTGKSVKRIQDVTGHEESQTAARCMVSNGLSFEHYVELDYGLDKIHSVTGKFGDFKIDNKALIVIDECSMLDIVLACDLLSVFENATILLMGDQDQLKSVRPGSFFAELIRSNVVPITKLVISMRAKYPEIVANADAMIRGSFDVNEKRNYTQNFMFLSCKDDALIQQNVLTWYNHFASKDSYQDILVMSPVHKGIAGVDALNLVLQDSVNAVMDCFSFTAVPDKNYHNKCFYQHRGCVCNGFSIGSRVDDNGKKVPAMVRVGDRIMCVQNDSDIELQVYEDNDPDSELICKKNGLFNGDIGVVDRYYPSETKNDVSYVMIQMDDGRCLYIDSDRFTRLRIFELGYAFTIHKSQGCEAKHVILSLPKRCGAYMTPLNPFLTRNLLYTGCTRAKESVMIIGNEVTFKRCLNTVSCDHNTSLCDDLRVAMNRSIICEASSEK